MRKLIITCDCCGKEIEQDATYSIEHYIHVSPSFNRMNGHVKVIDGKSYSVSGRSEKKDFCLPCYNMLFEKLFECIKRCNQDSQHTAPT